MNVNYLEERVFSTLEGIALLTIMDKDCSFIDDWHLSETLLGIQKNEEHCHDTYSNESTDHNVVLSHCAILFFRSLKHGYEVKHVSASSLLNESLFFEVQALRSHLNEATEINFLQLTLTCLAS